MRTTRPTFAGSKWRELTFALVLFSAPVFDLPAHAAVPADLDDSAISDAVEDEIASDLIVPVNRIDVTSTDGIVTLRGRVNTLIAKERAARIAESVLGVRSVINEILVNDYFNRTPAETERAIEEAFIVNPATESYDVNVDVGRDGTANLSGRVQSWAEKDLAERVAKTVVGVSGVNNSIEVNVVSGRSDATLEAEIEERLRWNVLIDDGLIDVSVNDGQAHLGGMVGSAAEKRLARQSAWVAGVSDVNVSDLSVARWARDRKLRDPEKLDVTDEAIKKAVETTLLLDPRISESNVTVESGGGVVVLRGTVVSLAAKRAAERDARNTVGVQRVENRLKVRPADGADDSTIADRVRAALARDTITERWDIGVIVRNGVITLTGVVDTYYEKLHADDIVGDVKGIEEVRNQLTVAKANRPYGYNPYYDRTPPYGQDWYNFRPQVVWESDHEIKQEIESRMWWSPFVDADDVTVTVENGIATLTGNVDTRAEREAALENALEGGAARVVNLLDVGS